MFILEKMASDFKAEVIATQLLAEELDVSKIIIDRLGNTHRTHTKDVFKSYEDISQYNLDKYTVLQSFRQSIYEAIPENVFHPPTLGGLGKTQDEIVEEIKIQRKKEAEARTFFKPFEQEAPYLEMQALMLELMYEKKGTYDNLYRLFEQGWPVISKLPYSTALSFIYILPILNEVRGNRAWTEKCLHFLTGFPVSIKENYVSGRIDETLDGFTLGNTALGVTSNFSGNQYDGLFGWDIHIGPVPENLTMTVLPQSGFTALLDILSEHFVPATLFVQYFIQSAPVLQTSLLPDAATGRLGYSFYL
jgi:regulator of replication initiation timing